ncbi:hypothetical protein LJD47_29090, partial [Escherichia coli]|nr:hypothetical protein [Escherichia coli]
YVDASADLDMARRIIVNAKMRRTGVCGSAETLLLDRLIAPARLLPLLEDLQAAGCEIRGDAAVVQLFAKQNRRRRKTGRRNISMPSYP